MNELKETKSRLSAFDAPTRTLMELPETLNAGSLDALVGGQWEYFLDHSYYDMWCVRRKTERKWGQGFHVNDGQEAEELCRILNEYEVR